jgi:hypothetical protein
MTLTLKSSPATASTKYAKGGMVTVIILPSSFADGEPQEATKDARGKNHNIVHFITVHFDNAKLTITRHHT